MEEFLILFAFGFVLFILGLYFNRRDARIFRHTIPAEAELVAFREYRAANNNSVMQTMIIEYKTVDGQLIHTEEQGGSNHPRYSVGDRFDIFYSEEKPELFQIRGDNTRKYAIIGMMAIGLVLMAVFGLKLISAG